MWVKLVKGLEDTTDGKGCPKGGGPSILLPMQGLPGAVGLQLAMQTALQWPEGWAGTH